MKMLILVLILFIMILPSFADDLDFAKWSTMIAVSDTRPEYDFSVFELSDSDKKNESQWGYRRRYMTEEAINLSDTILIQEIRSMPIYADYYIEDIWAYQQRRNILFLELLRRVSIRGW